MNGWSLPTHTFVRRHFKVPDARENEKYVVTFWEKCAVEMWSDEQYNRIKHSVDVSESHDDMPELQS
jgi:hypothetical protein